MIWRVVEEEVTERSRSMVVMMVVVVAINGCVEETSHD